MNAAQIEEFKVAALCYSAGIYILSIIISNLILKTRAASSIILKSTSRLSNIDGLRGVLAIGVFIHHSIAISTFSNTGEWKWGASPIFNQLGQTTVALFFMITGFLFCLKTSENSINWKKLYISRIARLAPLYFLVVALVFLTVGVLSKWEQKEATSTIVKEAAQWLIFVCLGRPDINAFPQTWTIIAGVNWSLKYEVLFYIFAIPLLRATQINFKPKTNIIITILLLTTILYIRYINNSKADPTIYIAHFLGGIIVAHIYKIDIRENLLKNKILTPLLIASAIYLGNQINAHGTLSIISSIIIFATIVGGFDFWGLLRTKALLLLGEASYGIYLLHGIILYYAVIIRKPIDAPTEITTINFLTPIILALTTTIPIAVLSFKYIEKPLLEYFTSKFSKV